MHYAGYYVVLTLYPSVLWQHDVLSVFASLYPESATIAYWPR